MAKVVNLTPHAINVQLNDEITVTYEPSGSVARVTSSSVNAGHVEGIPVIRTEFGAVEGLPAPGAEADTVYLVSALVLGRLGPEYSGVAFAPATGPNDGAIRNDKGHIVAVTKLVTV